MTLKTRIGRDETSMDGLTILRFTHATETAGGVEQYLQDLNNALLQRNSMKIVQLYLPLDSHGEKEVCQKIGHGFLIKVPMLADKQKDYNTATPWNKRIFKESGIKEMIRDYIVYNPMFIGVLKKLLIHKSYSRYNREPLNVREKLNKILGHHDVDLIVIHLAGGWGSSEIIREATSRRIPYLILNHFSNSWYRRIGFREQVSGAAGVGGVSEKDVPRYIRDIYRNLSDGIDTEFFKKDAAQPLFGEDVPLVMLPSRVVPEKGHKDMIYVAHILKKKGIKCRVVFAGRNNDDVFSNELHEIIREKEMADSIHFVGELSRDELRRHYASSSAIVLPSYNEGLGRVLLEAQSMGVPVVAYNAGGISEAIIDRVSGYLVKKGNISDLALRIGELLIDETKRITMGRAGRKFVEDNFSYPVFARRHEEWYLRAMATGA